MCGLWQLLFTGSTSTSCSGYSQKDQAELAEFFKAFMAVKPRGPENSQFSVMSQYNVILGFHRLAINGLRHISANQPFVYDSADDEGADPNVPSQVSYVSCNGEIYNYKELAKEYNITLKTGSDCEIIFPLYKKLGPAKMMEVLDSESAIIICTIDKATTRSKTFVSRDVCGIRPLYFASSADGIVCFSSELKGIPFIYAKQTQEQRDSNDDHQHQVQHFPPRTWTEISVDPSDNNIGSTSTQDLLTFNTFFDMSKIPQTVTDRSAALKLVREELIDAVLNRIEDCHREFACLLSGGLDSSLVSAITAFDVCQKRGKKLRTFCVGMCDQSPDVIWAAKVAEHIGSDHTTVIIPEKEWLDTVREVIFTVESFDITTIRASTGQFLISRWIAKNTDIKVLLIGDGSDELTGGYLYMRNAPSAEAFDQETLKLMNNIHVYDVQRSDRGVADNGLEARVPFLRRRFIEAYLSIDAKLRMPAKEEQEKQLLRDAFKGTKYLPDDILCRRKEALSDGVSREDRSWFQVLQEHIGSKYTDEEFLAKQQKYQYHLPPPTKEALYYREVFEEIFGQSSKQTAKVLPRFWLPNWAGDTSEPSARTLAQYHE